MTLKEKNEKHNEQSRRWYRDNRQQHLATTNRWRRANREKERAANRRRHAANPEKYREKWRRSYAANAEKRREESRQYRANNPAKWIETYRRSRYKAKYGMSLADYDAALVRQGGVCAICKGPQVKKRKFFDVDHNHVDGNIRGLLCSYCNLAIANFKDSPELAEAAARYLRKHAQLRLVG